MGCYCSLHRHLLIEYPLQKPIGELVVENEEEIKDEEATKHILDAFHRKTLTIKAVTFLGWKCNTTNKM